VLDRCYRSWTTLLPGLWRSYNHLAPGEFSNGTDTSGLMGQTIVLCGLSSAGVRPVLARRQKTDRLPHKAATKAVTLSEAAREQKDLRLTAPQAGCGSPAAKAHELSNRHRGSGTNRKIWNRERPFLSAIRVKFSLL
jgi:hypothetical protein